MHTMYTFTAKRDTSELTAGKMYEPVTVNQNSITVVNDKGYKEKYHINCFTIMPK